jgi:hypothetical protein
MAATRFKREALRYLDVVLLNYQDHPAIGYLFVLSEAVLQNLVEAD